MRWLIAIGELALMVWFLVIGIEAFWQRVAGMRTPFKLGEFHHAYLGVGFVLLGFVISGVTGILVQLLGVVISADDAYQHQVQTFNGLYDYRSPLHELFAATLWKLPGIPALVRFLDHWWNVGVVLGLLAVWLLSCAPASRVELVRRPDTRRFAGAVFDTAVMNRTVALFRAAFPKEAAVCLNGEVRDTAIGMYTFLVIRLHDVVPARADSANEFSVWYGPSPRSGCAGAVLAHAHSHPWTPPYQPCTHSGSDANVLFSDTRMLLSMVFCGDGRLEVLFQDGRRESTHWMRQAPP
jgi:hypothetical protein